MIVSHATAFKEAVQQTGGREKQALWYVMRIVGNKSDLLVQAVLDEIKAQAASQTTHSEATDAAHKTAQGTDSVAVATNKGNAHSASATDLQRTAKARKIVSELDETLLLASPIAYLYPTAYLLKSDRQRSVRHISPLLSGYIFVKATEELLVELVNRVPNFVFCYPRKIVKLKRIIVDAAEMQTFAQALEKTYRTHSIEIISLDEAREQLAQGTEVSMVGGLLDGLSGTLTQSDSHKQLLLTLANSFVLNIKLKRTDKTRRKEDKLIGCVAKTQ